jgi:hypothetical protein
MRGREKKTKSDGCAGNTNTAKLLHFLKMAAPNPHFEHLGENPGIGWVMGSFLAPFDEDPPDDEVLSAAAEAAAAARIEAKVTAMRAALSYGVQALEDLNSDMLFPHGRLIVEGASESQIEGSLHVAHRLYREVLHAIVKAHNELHADNRGHFFPDTEDSSPEDGALVAAQRMLKHEPDTESDVSTQIFTPESSVGTQIFTPEGSDEDMPQQA